MEGERCRTGGASVTARGGGRWDDGRVFYSLVTFVFVPFCMLMMSMFWDSFDLFLYLGIWMFDETGLIDLGCLWWYIYETNFVDAFHWWWIWLWNFACFASETLSSLLGLLMMVFWNCVLLPNLSSFFLNVEGWWWECLWDFLLVCLAWLIASGTVLQFMVWWFWVGIFFCFFGRFWLFCGSFDDVWNGLAVLLGSLQFC